MRRLDRAITQLKLYIVGHYYVSKKKKYRIEPLKKTFLFKTQVSHTWYRCW